MPPPSVSIPPPPSSSSSPSAAPLPPATPAHTLAPPSGAPAESAPRLAKRAPHPAPEQPSAESAARQHTIEHLPELQEALPEGWTSKVDPATGKTCYVCKALNKTQFEKPTAPVKSSGGKNRRSRQLLATMRLANASSGLPEGWKSKVDPTTGRTYYIDCVHKKTQWEKPTAAHAADTASVYATMKARPASEQFDLDNITGLVRHCDTLEIKRQGAGEPADGSGAGDALPAGWEALTDPSGKTYYANRELKKTQWERPTQ